MPWQPRNDRRGTSLLLVGGIHLALGAALLSGLGGETRRELEDTLATFDVALPVPPPEPEPPPTVAEPAREKEAGAEDLRQAPAPVVQPPPVVRLPRPSPLPTADDTAPVTGSAPSAGAGAAPGPGRGAGGAGDGSGGGGTGGNGAGGGGGLGSEARLLSGNLTRRDYRRIRSFGAPRGTAVLGLDIDAEGRMARCLPISSSGNPALDAELCGLLARTRWAPARNRAGAAVPVALRYVARWDRD